MASEIISLSYSGVEDECSFNTYMYMYNKLHIPTKVDVLFISFECGVLMLSGKLPGKMKSTPEVDIISCVIRNFT